MSTVPQRLSPGSSQIAKVDQQSFGLAMRAKDPVEAFAKHPTIATSVKALGESTVLQIMTIGVTKAFVDYFSPEQRMDPSMHASFAETIVEDYPHESPADVVLFIKYAARGRYGETKEVKNKDGDVIRRDIINKGKTFGPLTTTLAMDWFRQYLGEKADAIAKARIDRNKILNTTAGNGRFLEALKAGHAIGKEDEDKDTGRRVALLQRTVGAMDDDRLRKAWEEHPTRRERLVILEEANRRGLVQKKIEDHLKSTDDGNA